MTGSDHILAGDLCNPFIRDRLNGCAVNRDRNKSVQERLFEFILNTWLY
jgi:hypothetical protein